MHIISSSIASTFRLSHSRVRECCAKSMKPLQWQTGMTWRWWIKFYGRSTSVLLFDLRVQQNGASKVQNSLNGEISFVDFHLEIDFLWSLSEVTFNDHRSTSVFSFHQLPIEKFYFYWWTLHRLQSLFALNTHLHHSLDILHPGQVRLLMWNTSKCLFKLWSTSRWFRYFSFLITISELSEMWLASRAITLMKFILVHHKKPGDMTKPPQSVKLTRESGVQWKKKRKNNKNKSQRKWVFLHNMNNLQRILSVERFFLWIRVKEIEKEKHLGSHSKVNFLFCSI